MKVTLNLAEKVSSVSAAKAPKFKIQKVGGKKSLVIAKSASRDFKKAVSLAGKAHKGVSVLQKQRANLESAQEKLSKATAMNKDRMRGLVKTAKGKIADTKKLIKQYNSEASKLLKSNFGLAITVPFTTEDLCSPTKAKSAKMKTFDGVKVKGVTGFVKLAATVKDEAITSKPVKEAKKKDASTTRKQDKGNVKGSLEEAEEELSKRGRAKESADRSKKSATANKNVKISKSVPESHMKAIDAIAKNVTDKNSILKASGDKIQFEAKGFKATIKREGEEYKLTHSANGAGRSSIRGTLKSLANKLAKAVKAVEAVKGSKLSTGNYLKAAKGISPNAGK